MIKRILLVLLAVVTFGLGDMAWADIYDENADDAQPGQAVPLTCAPHPGITATKAEERLPAGTQLCEGFIMSKVTVRGNPAPDFDAALDVSVALPPGPGPFPILVQVHGYGGSKGGAGQDHLIVKEGIALVRHSTRGFGNSFGDNQLADEDFEIRDVQNIVRSVVEGSAFAALPPALFDRKKVAITGVSYGGGHSLLLAQSKMRSWPCLPDTCELVTAVPIVPWTDLVYSLIPNGRPGSTVNDRDYVVGIEKLSYVAGLFASGHRRDARYNFSSYPPFFFEYVGRINAGEPYQDPISKAYVPPGSGTTQKALQTFTQDRSAAYQDYCTGGPIPIFVLQGWTDDLFTAHEVLRLRDVLDAQCGSQYPLKLYLGNTGHPRARADDQSEINYMYSMVRPWLRYYLLGDGTAPGFDVVTGVTPPPSKDFDPTSAMRFSEFEDMMQGQIKADLKGATKLTYSPAPPTFNDILADPIASTVLGEDFSAFGANGEPLFKTVGPLTGDAAVYTIKGSDVTAGEYRTICGTGSLHMVGTVSATDANYAVRVWDVGPGTTRYLVDRGVYRFLGAPGAFKIEVPLHGNVWRLLKDHSLEVEITNTDTPYLRPNNIPSVTLITKADLDLPTCEAGLVRVEGNKKAEVLGVRLAATGVEEKRGVGLSLMVIGMILVLYLRRTGSAQNS